jgi:hypothetical protein
LQSSRKNKKKSKKLNKKKKKKKLHYLTIKVRPVHWLPT